MNDTSHSIDGVRDESRRDQPETATASTSTWKARCADFLERERRQFARIIGSRPRGQSCKENRFQGGEVSPKVQKAIERLSRS